MLLLNLKITVSQASILVLSTTIKTNDGKLIDSLDLVLFYKVNIADGLYQILISY